MLRSIILKEDAVMLNSLVSYFEKLDKALADVNEVLSKNVSEQVLFVKDGNKIISIHREEILYLEGYGDYVKIHRTEGKTLLSQVSLRKFEQILCENEFCRVHRSYIVAISKISYIEKKRIRIGSALLPISDSYSSGLMGKLMLQD